MFQKWLSVRIQKDFDAMIVVLPETNYGSLEEAPLRHARRQLSLLADDMDATFLILDLSSVERFGAALLGSLVEVAKRLREREKQLVVCGDRLGFCRLANLHSLFPVLDCLKDALDSCSAASKETSASRGRA